MGRDSNRRRRPFASALPRPARARAGRTTVEQTPLALRTFGVDIDKATKDYVRRRLGVRLGKYAPHIERVTVRFTDTNGPRGGVDVDCDVKVVLSGQRSVVYGQRGSEPREALDLATPGVVRAVQRALERARRPAAPGATARAARPAPRPRGATATPARLAHPSPHGSFIGRRVGRAAPNLERALERPEKTQPAFPVDTAAPGRSASDRKAGGGSTARRNTKQRVPRATAALEDSALDRPSRKSTRRSANRSPQGNKLRRRAVRETTAPQARATRAQTHTS